MRRLMGAATFAAALTMTAPVWAQTAEQLNQQQLSTMTTGAPAVPATVPPAPAYAGAPAPAYPYPYPYPYYPYPYPYPYPAYAPAYDYYPVGGVWIGGGCCWGGGWHGGGWHGGGGWHH